MDGILIDSEPIWRAVEREAFATVGIRLTDDDLIQTMGVRIGEVVEAWYRRHPWEGSSQQALAEAIVDRVAALIEKEGLNEGAVRAVEYFQGLGLRLGLASSSPIRLIRAVLSAADLAGQFEVIHSAEDEDRGKPDPAVYLSAARMLGAEPERCLALEDSVNGVRSAKSAGMVCVLIPEPGVVSDTSGGADLVLDSLGEVDDRIWTRTGTTPVSQDARR
jgi:sugar-phosphatase